MNRSSRRNGFSFCHDLPYKHRALGSTAQFDNGSGSFQVRPNDSDVRADVKTDGFPVVIPFENVLWMRHRWLGPKGEMI